jgi:glycosyltransferase involved in cell wall biosynthesis
MIASISIVVPTYDRAESIKRLFKSILDQDISPLEVIIVDDTPSSDVEELCKNWHPLFAEKGVELIYLRNPRRRSAAVARNVGAEHARGDIVLFLDTDIVLLPGYLQGILRTFQENPNAVGVSGYIVNIGEASRRVRLLALKNLFNLVFKAYYRYLPNRCRFFEYPSQLTRTVNCEWLTSSNTAYKREVFLKYKFDENLEGYSFMEDVLLSYKIFRDYPKGLYITPLAKCIHEEGSKDIYGSNLDKHRDNCRKYVLVKLFGLKGLLLYHWQNLGRTILKFLKLATLSGWRGK